MGDKYADILISAYDRGRDEADATVGNLDEADVARAFWLSITDADEHLLTEDYGPASEPLSGEWPGGSIPEVFSLAVGADFPDDETLSAYEDRFYDGYWSRLHEALRERLRIIVA